MQIILIVKKGPERVYANCTNCEKRARKGLYKLFVKEALATILTKKIVCFGNW
jgi:hypothetical protein